MADLDNKLVTFESLKETVTRLKEYANQFEPRKEVVAKAKLTYSTNYIRAYCDYVATIPATVRVTDDDGSVLLITGSSSGSWRAVRLIKGETSRFHKVYYSNGYVYIQVDNDSMYTVFGGVQLKVFGSATGLEIPIENAADTDLEIPTSYPANAISYVNDTVGSATVDDALNKLISKVYYVAPRITSFTMTPATTEYEIGQTVNSLTFNWAVNKDITTQSLTDCTVTVDDRTATYDTPITSNKTFTLSIGDGENTATASKTISFKNKAYWGSSTEGTYDSAFILGLSNSKFTTSKNGSYSMTIATGEYGFLALPTSFGTVSSCWIGGFEVTLDECGTIDFTNASGYTTEYKIYKTGQQGLGSISMEVK